MTIIQKMKSGEHQKRSIIRKGNNIENNNIKKTNDKNSKKKDIRKGNIIIGTLGTR